ncbi:tyrosine-protein phosphatase [Gammaproteobacteria bacterium]|nr:tyrosine-protein phosphatase [Gammaproteobacteria bacterium]
MLINLSDRHHAFEASFNFRDIGGYPSTNRKKVRWGRYYRAGRQDRMTESDLRALKKLNIRTQIDLRKSDEIRDQGKGPLASMGATHHNIPVIPDGGTDTLSRLVGDTGISGKRYLGYLEFGPATWVRLFDLFSNASTGPLVLHCTAGKDRTGVSTAFLLSVLGVDRDWIEADYQLTNWDVERQVNFIEEHIGLPEGMSREDMVRAAGVPEDAIGDFLDGIEERWGGPLEYLKSIGISDQTFASIRANYLE